MRSLTRITKSFILAVLRQNPKRGLKALIVTVLDAPKPYFGAFFYGRAHCGSACARRVRGTVFQPFVPDHPVESRFSGLTKPRRLAMNNRLAGTSAPDNLNLFINIDEELHKISALIAALEAVLYDDAAVDFHQFLLARINQQIRQTMKGVYAGIDGEHKKLEVNCG